MLFLNIAKNVVQYYFDNEPQETRLARRKSIQNSLLGMSLLANASLALYNNFSLDPSELGILLLTEGAVAALGYDRVIMGQYNYRYAEMSLEERSRETFMDAYRGTLMTEGLVLMIRDVHSLFVDILQHNLNGEAS